MSYSDIFITSTAVLGHHCDHHYHLLATSHDARATALLLHLCLLHYNQHDHQPTLRQNDDHLSPWERSRLSSQKGRWRCNVLYFQIFPCTRKHMILSSISMAILNVNNLKRQALSAPISLLHTIQPFGYTLSSTLSSLDPPRTIEIELHISRIVEH